jgi:CBS domain-containing protein
MIIADIMTAFPETLSPEDTIQKAAKLMRDHDYGSIPIIDDIGALVGIVTDRDIVVQAIAAGRGVETELSSCMTMRPDAVPKDLPLSDALRLMEKQQIRRLPVVENGRLIGMVSLSDLAKSQVSESEKSRALESVSAGGGDFRPGAELPE